MRYSQIRLILAAVALIFYLFELFPIPAIVISVVLIFGYILFTRLSTNNTEKRGQTLRRKAALDTAKAYLSPYKDIWHNLKLSNKFCSLHLGSNGTSITAREKGKDLTSYRTFRVVSSKVHNTSDLWDMFCINFSHNTTYDGLVEDCRLYKVVISESVVGISYALSDKSKAKGGQQQSAQPLKPVEKVDINNASEIELTDLPGISIVMAKKIIKKREEISGFKNINEFFIFLKLKPHLEQQLRSLVCANSMKGSLKIERYNERNIDL